MQIIGTKEAHEFFTPYDCIAKQTLQTVGCSGPSEAANSRRRRPKEGTWKINLPTGMRREGLKSSWRKIGAAALDRAAAYVPLQRRQGRVSRVKSGPETRSGQPSNKLTFYKVKRKLEIRY